MNDYSANVGSSIDNRVNKILVLLQLFFHYSSIQHIHLLISLIQQVKPLQSIQQLLFLTKLIAPFTYRIATNSSLLQKVIHSLQLSIERLQ